MQTKLKINYNGILVLLLIFTVSCVPFREVRYFNDDKELNEPYNNARVSKKIKPFDNLYVRVLSTDEKNSKIFNASEEMRNIATSNMISYTVDENGNISFPFAGDINVDGLTTAQAAIKIQRALGDYISNTAVVVKFIDNKITLMGEVQRPGLYPFTDDKINIYEALSLGGGLTRFGNHKKIILIRQDNAQVKHYKLDLSNSKIAGSDMYYLLPNDVIVVEPLRSVSFSYQNMTYATILTTVTTLVTLLYFFNNTKL
jgi:polysaccharide biosynthesis/export protein